MFYYDTQAFATVKNRPAVRFSSIDKAGAFRLFLLIESKIGVHSLSI